MSDPSSAASIRSLSWTVLGGLGRALLAGVRGLRRARRPLAALLARVGFWGALLLWCTTSLALVSGATIDVRATLTRFVLGAAVCAVITLTCEHARLRWLTALVGSLHGIAAVALWLVA